MFVPGITMFYSQLFHPEQRCVMCVEIFLPTVAFSFCPTGIMKMAQPGGLLFHFQKHLHVLDQRWNWFYRLLNSVNYKFLLLLLFFFCIFIICWECRHKCILALPTSSATSWNFRSIIEVWETQNVDITVDFCFQHFSWNGIQTQF